MLLPYSIDFTDSEDPSKTSFQIQPGQINTTATSLSLPGKGRVDYGELCNENLVHLLENFASPTPPENPTKGQLWYDTIDNALRVFNEGHGGKYNNWMELVATGATDRLQIPVVVDVNALPLPAAGDLAYQSTDNKLYIYDNVAWRSIATQFWCENYLTIDGGLVNFE
jgi:hypothetical protein